MVFKIGDQVVHPQHGVGSVSKLESREFVAGATRPYYEIALPQTTLWVPQELQTSGLRKLALKSEIESCRLLLKSPASPLNEDPRSRQGELVEHLKLGTFKSQCEVVRDLTAYGWHKPLSGTIANFLRVVHDVLCQEWAVVERIQVWEAAQEIDGLLEQGRQKQASSG
ncbi:MAG: CarD family transcriptional regulator [Anaerolineales bacterium]